MDPITGLIAGGASLLGSFFSNQTSASNTQAQIAAQQQMLGQTEQFNAGQAADQMAFQRSMLGNQQAYNDEMFRNQTELANTAYQRSRADMVAAGLNPILAASAGGASVPSAMPVSSPSGAAASVGTPTVPMSQRQGPFAGIGTAVSSAIDAMVKGKYADKMSQEIANLDVEKTRTEAQTKYVQGQSRIQEPEVRTALIRMGMPDDLVKGLTYAHDIAGGVKDVAGAAGSVGDAFWSLSPLGNAIKSLIGGSAKTAGKVGEAVGSGVVDGGSANAVRRGMEIERALSKVKPFDPAKAGSGNFIEKYGTPIDEYSGYGG